MKKNTRSVLSLACLFGITAIFAPAFCYAQGYTITTVAGGGSCGSNGDGGPATSACVGSPWDVAVDAVGNLYIASGTIRKVTPNGIITTVAGGGSGPGIGDGGPATQAALSPTAVAIDSTGNLYIADAGHDRIRKVDTHGTITTVAGNGIEGASGDGGPGTSAAVGQVLGVAVDSIGNLYFVGIEKLLRKIDTNGIITTIAGRGTSSGDGGPAADASFGYPTGVAVDMAGNIYVADANVGKIRKVSTSGIITTVAGNGTSTYSGDGGPATQAGIDSPWHVAVDGARRIYITERRDPFGVSSGNFVRQVAPDGTITTIAGNGTTSASGDGGPATSAGLNLPEGIAVASAGVVYIADNANNRVRLLTPPLAGSPPSITSGGVGSASAFGQFAAIAPGSWIEIYGSNLAVDSRGWAGSDFVGVNAPTSLDGTKVTIGGQLAFIDYISPTQVNAQVPSNVGTGPQQLIVTTAAGASGAYTVTVNAEEPGLLAPSSFNIGGKQNVVALFLDGVTYVLPPGAIGGVTSRRAKPGDTITLYGIGFGPVTPNIPAGQIVQQSNALALPLHLFFGQTEAMVSFAGLVSSAVGLYQFNVVVPNVASSDTAPLTFTLGGASGTQTLYIAVQ